MVLISETSDVMFRSLLEAVEFSANGYEKSCQLWFHSSSSVVRGHVEGGGEL